MAKEPEINRIHRSVYTRQSFLFRSNPIAKLLHEKTSWIDQLMDYCPNCLFWSNLVQCVVLLSDQIWADIWMFLNDLGGFHSVDWFFCPVALRRASHIPRFTAAPNVINNTTSWSVGTQYSCLGGKIFLNYRPRTASQEKTKCYLAVSSWFPTSSDTLSLHCT